jgi:hypothetical protein
VERKISCFWKERGVAAAYRTAVSLHGHTNFSQESLHFIVEFMRKSGILRWVLAMKDREAMRESKVNIDFKRAYWTPPLTPSAAYELETRQITEQLGLRSFVSLTDHDNIHAARLLRVHKDRSDVPVSVEWSVPYRGGELHIGLHNLPPGEADAMVATMNGYTEKPNDAVLTEVLSDLHARKDVLVVLNHPLWDIVGAGQDVHRQAVQSFMAKLGDYVHAFELGGVRNWEENRQVCELAYGWNVPVVAGGDRHGCEPSACLNLTNAKSFPEFIDEVRTQKRTHVLFMPQYARPMWVRRLEVVLDATRVQPDNPAGAYWDDRTFHPDYTGTMRPISQLWVRRPAFIELTFGAFRLIESAVIRQAIDSQMRRRQQQMHLQLGQEEA